ncbi:MAG: FGGY family carbohydrate kinase [Spirochaetota bacterium]
MPDTQEFFLSLDIGTTSIKVTIFDKKGNLVESAIKEYKLLTPTEDVVELDAETYWTCCVAGIREILAKPGVSPQLVKSIGVCSQGETVIVVGKSGRPLRKAIVWMDNRSQKEADEIRDVFGKDNTTGQIDVLATWPVTKILWLRKHEPDVYRKAWKYILVEDYILYRLTGGFDGEYSLYCSSYMLDIVNKQWWREILDFAGISPDQLVKLHESGEIIGVLQPAAASELGMPAGIPVVTGAMDQVAAMIGAGSIEEGIVTETIGAALVICETLKEIPKKKQSGMTVQYHAIPDMYLILGWITAGGMSFKWLRDTFFTHEKENSEKEKKDPYDAMTEMAKNIPIGSQGLVFMPFMAGPGTLRIKQALRGIFYGVELHHTKAHFARAVMESLAFAGRQILDEMAALGYAYKEIRSLGGGSKSRLWNQIRSDVLGKKLITMKYPESASLGVAILQACATGVYPDIKTAVNNMVQVSSVVEPIEKHAASYKIAYERYLNIAKNYFI